MKPHETTLKIKDKKALRQIYLLLLIFMGFTGFGQMPIFKRYYLADIPGLGWTADFYLTHMLHYLGAILLLGIIAYVIMDYFLSVKRDYSLTFSAYIRIVLLTGIVVTGIFRVLKNLPDIVFSPDFTMFIDISHLAFMMFYIFFALIFLIMKSGWFKHHE
jgi:hypothetical protein